MIINSIFLLYVRVFVLLKMNWYIFSPVKMLRNCAQKHGKVPHHFVTGFVSCFTGRLTLIDFL